MGSTGLETEHLQRLRRRISEAYGRATRPFTRGEHIYNWGHFESSIYLICSGLVKSVRYSRTGKPCVLRIDGPDDFLGLPFLLDGHPTETAVAKTDVAAIAVPRHSFREVLVTEQLEGPVYHYLAQRIEAQSSSLEYFVTLDSQHRLGAMLLQLGRQFGERSGSFVRVGYPFTHEELGQMVGTTRSRVGYFLQEFERSGLVRRRYGSLELNEHGIEGYLAD